VLVEVAFLSNSAEAKRLADPSFQDQISSTLVKSILNFKARYERPQTSQPAP
jgi:N-acetylmuramoyl-L-alanine amidase